MRLLTEGERANLAFLTSNDVTFGALQPTKTGLEKSILDATEVFREFLEAAGIHDYSRQPQGPDHKLLIPVTLFGVAGDVASKGNASLYRPITKSGDPRIWFSGLPKVARPDDIVVVIWHQREFFLANISIGSLAKLVDLSTPLSDLLTPYLKSKSQVVDKLVDLLRSVAAKGFIRAPVVGSTAVGRLLETELGIEINSRRDPDFQGIELKSSRALRNRATIFAKTPDWSRSRLKSSREILEAFGYDRDGARKLSCTLSGKVVNSQGLSLVVKESLDELHAVSDRQDPRVAIWDLAALRHSLSAKHNETFWVKAESKMVDGWEYLRFTGAEHTSRPMIDQLAPTLAVGLVTVDFLIREYGDKGYLFKIFPRDMKNLFPPPTTYQLAT